MLVDNVDKVLELTIHEEISLVSFLSGENDISGVHSPGLSGVDGSLVTQRHSLG